MAETSSSSTKKLTKKRQKRNKKTNGDRISDLPDSLLCHILSFLPTDDVVQTCILSSRWRYLWSCVPNLRFDYEYADLDMDVADVEVFVNRVMLLLRVPCIKKFFLRLGEEDYDPSHVNAWVCAAIMRNVEELHLSFRFEMAMKLPPVPNYCDKLVVLELHGPVTLNVPSSACFPSLKLIYFDNLKLSNDSIETILSASPVLEDFSIHNEYFISDGSQTMLRICSPSLKQLALSTFCDHVWDFTVSVSSEYQRILYIDTPKLEVLELDRLYYSAYDMMNLSSLVEAHINVFAGGMMTTSSFVALLNQISNVKALRFSSIFLERNLDVEFSAATFSRFSNLTYLDIEVAGAGGLMIPNILESSPNLEVLVVSKDLTDDEDIIWSPHEAVPQCMLYNIKMIELKRFECGESVKIAEYFLKNSMVLEKMIISRIRSSNGFKSSDSMDNIVKRLLMFPKASSTCQIVFDE